MSNSVTFETSALASSASRADRVAPRKGTAFDKANGVLITVLKDGTVTVKATDLEVSYHETLTALSVDIEGELIQWRLPSQLLAGFLESLPQGSQVKFSQTEGILTMSSGKTKARLHPSRDISPALNFDPYDESGMIEVKGLARRINQVAWACNKETIPLSGVHLNGTHLIATDKYKIVRVPCEIDIKEPITFSVDSLMPVIRTVEDVHLKADAEHLYLMTDEYTQLSSVIFGPEFPDTSKIVNLTFPSLITFSRVEMRETLARMLGLLGRSERYPMVSLTIDTDDSTVKMNLEVDDLGSMSDEISCEIEGLDVGVVVLFFAPEYIISVLDHTDAEQVIMDFDSSKPRMAVHFHDSADYEAWVMPRTGVAPAKGGGA